MHNSFISVFPKKGTNYLNNSDFKHTIEGNNISISPKKKKLPSSGDLYYGLFTKFEITDSTGTTFSGECSYHGSHSY